MKIVTLEIGNGTMKLRTYRDGKDSVMERIRLKYAGA